jgi:hypothetical protein
LTKSAFAPSVYALFVYPVKSLAGLSVAQAEVGDRGFAHDRRFLLVDEAGVMITQREEPRLARVSTAFAGEGESAELVLGGEIRVPLCPPPLPAKLPGRRGQGGVRVTVWSDRLTAQPVDDRGYFTELLKRPVRLVYMPEHTRRRVDGRYGRKGDLTSFADGFPFLVVSTASMIQLAHEHGRGLDVRRFRPNLVLTGLPAYGEDKLEGFRLGDVTFHRVKPCSRCLMVDVDPDTGRRGGGVLKTLARTRLRRKRVYFGQNLVHDGRGLVSVGDAVVRLPRP